MHQSFPLTKPIIFLALVLSLIPASNLFAGDGELIILHTNDFHGAFLPREASWIDSRPMIGGFEPLSGALKIERERNQHILLLDAGDFMTGNPITDLEINGAVGGAMLQFFGLLNYDLITLGNHEFDVNTLNAKRLVATSKTPIVSANIRHIVFHQQEMQKLLTDEGWKIFNAGGVRVGVIGLVMENLTGSISKIGNEDLRISSPVKEVRAVVQEIDPQTDLIVLLTHQGIDADRNLAQQVENVDVIVGGHSHTPIDPPQITNNIIIVQAGAYCRYLGKLWLKVEDDKVVDHEGRLIPLWADSLQAIPEIAALVKQYQDTLGHQLGKTLLTLNEDWIVASYEESALGSWLADRLREYGNGDVAFVNSGGIRKDLFKGPLRVMDIREMLPFSNRVVSFPCTGEQLQKLVETNTAAGASRNNEILQVSGLSYKIVRATEKPTEILVNGEPLDLNKTYKCISIDYVAISQPERYFGFTPQQTEDLGIQFTNLIIKCIKNQGMKQKPPSGRITWIPGNK